jgi:deazaflavin-dependent oxidoreductase (nitroreductase family)
MRLLLRSPLHSLLGKSFMLLTYTGRKSGNSYTLPVQFVRSGENLLIVSASTHSWWRNLRNGAPVTLRIGSQDVNGEAQVLENAASATGLMNFLEHAPHLARYFHVSLNAAGKPDAVEVAQAAKGKVVVQIQAV